MSVSFSNDKIIFDRKLTPGVGPNHYGIKIAESLGLSKKFISLANQIHHRLNGDANHIVNQKKSVYNSDILIGKCEMPECNKDACETHHIYEQADCDENGNTIGTTDVFDRIQAAREHFTNVGLGPKYVNQFIR